MAKREEMVAMEMEAGEVVSKRRKVECGGGSEKEEGGVRFLPKMPVRVLLVEGDDSTRQIIAALLRKCSYRVDSAADGLKAWEILKEKHHSIDLVLTEVDLPSVSGFVLLTMIMEHDSYKNIPVIMMSSQDSISMVFKCMLRGAADFLVKPVRKNELSNLWQHVWRRRLSIGNHDGSNSHRDANFIEEMLEANFENDASHSSGECVDYKQKNKENTEKVSDAQSSCTRSEMEAESKCTHSKLEVKESNGRNSYLIGSGTAQNGEEHGKLDRTWLMHDDGQDRSILLVSEVSPCKEACNSSNFILDAAAGAVLETMNQGVMRSTDSNNLTDEIGNQICDGANSREARDLIGALDIYPRRCIVQRDGSAVQNDLANTHEKDVKYQSSSVRGLELSLRRDHYDDCDGQENNECRNVHHSNSSAFSLYNSRTKLPTLLRQANGETENRESFSISADPVVELGSCDLASARPCDGAAPGITMKYDKPKEVGYSIPEGVGVQCSPIRVVPFPVPVMWQGGGSSVVPMFYPQPGTPFWSAVPSTKEVQQHSLPQSELEKTVPARSNESLADNLQEQKQCEILELMHELRHASSSTGGNGSRSILTSSKSHLDSSRCASKSIGNVSEPNTSISVTDGGNEDGLSAHEGRKPADIHHLSQREAALNKFRLKRKDRCFEKKVRYQSRKRLAELRPRVKGQFVRQAQGYPSDAAVV